MSKRDNIGQELFSGSALLGRVSALISLVFITLFALVIIIFCIMMLIKGKTRPLTSIGTVINDPVCTPYSSSSKDDSSGLYRCSDVHLQYTINGTILTRTFSSIDKNYKLVKGSTIDLYYNPSHIDDIAYTQEAGKLVYAIILVVSLIIMFGSWMWVYLVNRAKGIAAMGGAMTVINMLKN